MYICQIRGKFKFRYRYEVCTYLWVFWRPRTSTDYSEVMVQILLSIEPVPDFLLGITKLGQIRMWTSILGSYFGTASNHRSSDTMEVEVFIKRIWINDKAATWKKNGGMEKLFYKYFFLKKDISTAYSNAVILAHTDLRYLRFHYARPIMRSSLVLIVTQLGEQVAKLMLLMCHFRIRQAWPQSLWCNLTNLLLRSLTQVGYHLNNIIRFYIVGYYTLGQRI